MEMSPETTERCRRRNPFPRYQDSPKKPLRIPKQFASTSGSYRITFGTTQRKATRRQFGTLFFQSCPEGEKSQTTKVTKVTEVRITEWQMLDDDRRTEVHVRVPLRGAPLYRLPRVPGVRVPGGARKRAPGRNTVDPFGYQW